MPFADVIGQDAAAAALSAHLARTGGAGSTLVVGPPGVGRFLLAHRAARAILGTTPAAAARVDALQHVDLHVLDAGAGIQGVRDAVEALARRPSEGARAVLIVRDADRMSEAAHNALLKTLEEPPADAALFVVATGPEALPETVVSRCRLVRARALTDGETAEVLARLGLPAEAAVDAEGSPGRAALHCAWETGAAADLLLRVLQGAEKQPLAACDKLVQRKPGEESKTHRRRLEELLRVAAARLRRGLPEEESVLRSVLEALGSLRANAHPGILFTHLALAPWQATAPRN